MPVRSLRQEEAVERAALLSVSSYDIAVDLTALPDGPAFRAVSTVRFTATAGASTFVDCCAEVESATLNGEPLPPAEEGRIVLDGLADDNVLVVASVQADTTHGRGVHRAVDPADDNVYLWTTFEPDEARYAWACFDQPDLKAPHAFTVTAPSAGPWSATRATRSSRTSTAPAAGRSRPPRRCRRTTPSWWRGRSSRSGARSTASTSASTPARPSRTRCGATPTSSSPSPPRAWSSSASGSGCRSRSAATTRCSCRSSAGRWRTTAASPGATTSSGATSRPRRSGRSSPTCCCTRWRTCGSATS